MKFELTILGCGSATPTLRRNPTAQVLNVRDKFFLIDCGEGTQVQLRRHRVKFQRIDCIFISHMHGDHYFGLLGFISTMHLLGRTRPLDLYGPPLLQEIIRLQLEASQTFLKFKLEFHPLSYDKSEVIYEDDVLTVETIVLKHRIDCNGFLFREKPKPHNMKREMIDELDIPLEKIAEIKEGADFVKENGEVVPNASITKPRPHSASYAFCSDTAFHPPIIDQIKNVDLLYHEATFLQAMADRAKATFHSTAEQAATIAHRAGAKQLIVGHYSARYKDVTPFYEEASQIFPNTLLAEEGKSYRIN
jgi:ribonuclease Z